MTTKKASWTKDQIVLVVNQDSRQSVMKAKNLHKFAKANHLRTVMCQGADLDYTLRTELKAKSLKRIIVAGGDGSIALAASLLVRQKRKIELAVLPTGTSNYYSRTLGIKSLQHACEVAMSRTTEKRHVCSANGRIFLMVAGIGVSSEMLDRVTDEEKRKLGKIAYILGIFKLLFTFSPMRVKVTANGKSANYVTTELQVINQNVEERVHLQPKVHSTQPYFEIVTYGVNNNKLSPIFALLVMIVTFGKNQKYLKRIKATEALIETTKPRTVSLDGDSIEQSPLKVKLLESPVLFATARE